jgi:hypothetical protein
VEQKTPLSRQRLLPVAQRRQCRVNFHQRFPRDRATTVASRNEMIVEIISLLAFTFKIPFH